MPFDPDSYIASKKTTTAFNPDEYIASKQLPEGGLREAIEEPIFAIGSGLAGKVASGLTGLAALPFEGLDKAVERMRGVEEAVGEFSAPKTLAGQEGLRMAAEGLEKVAETGTDVVAGLAGLGALGSRAIGLDTGDPTEVIRGIQEQGAGRALGLETLRKTGSPAAATAVQMLPELAGAAVPISRMAGGKIAATNKLVSRLRSGDTSKDLAPFRIDKTGLPVKDPNFKPLVNKGFEPGTLSMVKASSDVDKGQMTKMLGIKKRAIENPRWGAENRPSDIVGESLQNRVNYVRRVNAQAGAEVNQAAKKLRGKQIDASKPVKQFTDDLAELDIRFDNQTLTASYDDSVLFKLPKAQKVIDDAIDFLKHGKAGQAPDAFRLHQAKKYIDNVVDYGKAEGGATGDVKRVLKNLRHNINETLRAEFPNYKKANVTFSETVDALNGLQDLAGKRINITTPEGAKAMGTLGRRVLSNAQSRIPITESIKNIDGLAKKYGAAFNDDIISQVKFADDLDKVFGASADTSFLGDIQKAVKTGSATEKAGGIVSRVIKKAVTPDEAKAFEQLENMLKYQPGQWN